MDVSHTNSIAKNVELFSKANCKLYICKYNQIFKIISFLPSFDTIRRTKYLSWLVVLMRFIYILQFIKQFLCFDASLIHKTWIMSFMLCVPHRNLIKINNKEHTLGFLTERHFVKTKRCSNSMHTMTWSHS